MWLSTFLEGPSNVVETPLLVNCNFTSLGSCASVFGGLVILID